MPVGEDVRQILLPAGEFPRGRDTNSLQSGPGARDLHVLARKRRERASTSRRLNASTAR